LSKIIIIGPAFPLRGGLSTFNERLAREFISQGHEVIIYTFSLQYPSFLFPGKTQLSKSSPPTDLNIQVKINSINPVNWFITGNKLKKEEADIVLVRYWLPFMAPCLGTILRIVSRNKKSKIIGLIDNALPHEKRLGDKILTRYFTSTLHGFVTMSNHVSMDLRQFTKQPVHLVQHPLYDNFGTKYPKSDARELLNLPQDGFIFLFFGFIRHYKGLDLLISALDSINSDHSKKYLLIAGEFYADENEIKEQIKNSRKKDMIISHTEFINDEKVGLYFSASDCVIQPYRNATQSGVTPLAYHFEIPMIVSNVGALPDMVPPELGFVCEPNPTDIASAMNKMDTFDYKMFEKVIAEEKKKLSWQNLTKVIFAIANEKKEHA